MPFPGAFLALTHRPEFWSQYFFESGGQEFPELDNCRLEFPVGTGRALTLDLDSSLGYFGLGLRHPGAAEPAEIGWDDQAHWHPHVLRWEELDLVCRCVALGDPTLPHPALPLVLLHRFTPICLADDDAIVHPLITEAYRTVGAFTEARITDMVHRYDRRQSGFLWEHAEPHGWHPNVGGDDMRGLYSLRRPQNTEFPFTELDALLTAARDRLASAIDPAWLAGSAGQLARAASTGDLSAMPALADALQEAGCAVPTLLDGLRASASPVRGCAVVETLLGTRPGEVIARALGHTRRPPRVTYRFDFSIPADPAGPQGYDPDRVDRRLDTALRQAGLGRAGSSSATYTGTPPRMTEFLVTATVHDDRERGLAMIRDVLTRAQVPRTLLIRLTAPTTAVYPLAPGDPM